MKKAAKELGAMAGPEKKDKGPQTVEEMLRSGDRNRAAGVIAGVISPRDQITLVKTLNGHHGSAFEALKKAPLDAVIAAVAAHVPEANHPEILARYRQVRAKAGQTKR